MDESSEGRRKSGQQGIGQTWPMDRLEKASWSSRTSRKTGSKAFGDPEATGRHSEPAKGKTQRLELNQVNITLQPVSLRVNLH